MTFEEFADLHLKGYNIIVKHKKGWFMILVPIKGLMRVRFRRTLPEILNISLREFVNVEPLGIFFGTKHVYVKRTTINAMKPEKLTKKLPKWYSRIEKTLEPWVGW